MNKGEYDKFRRGGPTLTTKQKGYGADWEKVRLYKLHREPFCELRTHCQGAVATEVDHVIPIRVRPDLRLVLSNLRSSCTPCNKAKVHTDKRKYPRKFDKPQGKPDGPIHF